MGTKTTAYSVYADGFGGDLVVSRGRSADYGVVLLGFTRWRHKLGFTDHQPWLSPVPIVKHRLTTGHLARSLPLTSVNHHIHTLPQYKSCLIVVPSV